MTPQPGKLYAFTSSPFALLLCVCPDRRGCVVLLACDTLEEVAVADARALAEVPPGRTARAREVHAAAIARGVGHLYASRSIVKHVRLKRARTEAA